MSHDVLAAWLCAVPLCHLEVHSFRWAWSGVRWFNFKKKKCV